MKKAHLEHILRSAARIGDDNEIIVIGSQSILGQFPEAEKDPMLSYSVEVDLYLKNKTQNTILVEGAIGEGSLFHVTFGYYAQEVGPETAILPRGWENRLFPVLVNYDNGLVVTGYCLEAHDLAVAKYAAGREKDFSFIAVMINKGMLRKKELFSRIRQAIGINHGAIIERAKQDFKSYANNHIDYRKTFGFKGGAPANDFESGSDKEKDEFLERLKKRRGR